ncbi:MAG TPA: SH3 domain-containing protein, partial [Sulfitobacter sp.]|nr:SH3 domain-containing protein [Sulfitobacter sp.]
MRRITFAAVSTLIFVAGCAGVAADQVMVHRTGPDELLKLRSGPGLDFGVIMGLPDG